ncbi:MAG: Putative Fe-S oxidoreductase [uncultured Sulfurovum sp.]|uniref:Fe-S oxidoreductase n=1 Tax=uncultured Sulfurovum sp. TaxID=269237 RepID=A0A6S6TS47_9BACT|nr:MAG: Putative Fe-S oxidoreductase [uncultured Sulfurovum sp.]
MNIIFGPVNSRRFGKSLGLDLSPSKKQCNFDCLYCELSPAKTMGSYEDVISVQEIMNALNATLGEHQDIDVLTITANGEPTLYPHLSELMDEINKVKGTIKTLILSNAANIHEIHIQEALQKFDTVKLSLDCATGRCLKRLDRAHQGVKVEEIKSGMLSFKEKFFKPLIIEILIVKALNDNDEEIEALNEYLLVLKPTRIDIGTIDRPPAYYVEPLSYEALREISLKFDATLPIYIATRKMVTGEPSHYSSDDILETIKKRPLTLADVEVLFDKESQARLQILVDKNEIEIETCSGYDFFVQKS